MEALFAEERQRDDVMFATPRGMVGAFEGARYEAKGYYRPEANCIMFTRADFFCAVCRRALEQVIDTYSRNVGRRLATSRRRRSPVRRDWRRRARRCGGHSWHSRYIVPAASVP